MGPLVLLYAVSALAQQAAPPDKPAVVQAVTVTPPATDHDSYLQKTHGELLMWRARIDEFGSNTKTTADRDFHSAWVHMQDTAATLQTVGAEGWASARASYEKASNDVADTWHRVHPEKT
jgi:hypothetical protein